MSHGIELWKLNDNTLTIVAEDKSCLFLQKFPTLATTIHQSPMPVINILIIRIDYESLV